MPFSRTVCVLFLLSWYLQHKHFAAILFLVISLLVSNSTQSLEVFSAMTQELIFQESLMNSS